MEELERTTTIRVSTGTAKVLKLLGRKDESYDQIIRKLLPHTREYAPEFLCSLEEAAKEPSIPGEKVPWDEIYDLSEEELDELLASLAEK